MSVFRYFHDPLPLTATTALTAVWQLRYSTAATAFNCHMAVDELNCYMAVATTAMWQWPQTAICRSQLPKLHQQQLVVIPIMLRRPMS